MEFCHNYNFEFGLSGPKPLDLNKFITVTLWTNLISNDSKLLHHITVFTAVKRKLQYSDNSVNQGCSD